MLERLRRVAAAKGRSIATVLDTKGPEIRTAMLKGGHDIELHVRRCSGAVLMARLPRPGAALVAGCSAAAMQVLSTCARWTQPRSPAHAAPAPAASPALQADQRIVLVAVGDAYDTWEGGVDEASGQVRIGISYARLCQSVRPGNLIKVADGSLTVEVEQVLSGTELLARWAGGRCRGQAGRREMH